MAAYIKKDATRSEALNPMFNLGRIVPFANRLTFRASVVVVIAVTAGPLLFRLETGLRRAPSEFLPASAKHVLPSALSDAERDRLLEVVKAEKALRFTEMNDYSKRLESGIVFYLTAVVGVIVGAGIRAGSEKEHFFARIRAKPYTPCLVFLFLLVNLAMLIQGLFQLSMAMVNAKFVALFLDPQISALSRAPNEVLGWDRWVGGDKGQAFHIRDTAGIVWLLVVLIISLLSLLLVDRTKLHPLIAHRGVRWAGTTSIGVLLFYLIWEQFQRIFLGNHFFDARVEVPTRLLAVGAVVASFSICRFGLFVMGVGDSLFAESNPEILGERSGGDGAESKKLGGTDSTGEDETPAGA